MTTSSHFLFHPGKIGCTFGAVSAFFEERTNGRDYLRRHVTGDDGDVAPTDCAENDFAIKHHFRIMSAYILPRTKVMIWVITEADRSATTFLLPSEY